MAEDYKEKYLIERVNFLVSQSELMQSRFSDLQDALKAAKAELEKFMAAKAKKETKKKK